MNHRNPPTRTILTASCTHLERIAGTLGLLLIAMRRLPNQPTREWFPLLPLDSLSRSLPAVLLPSQSLSDSSESCGNLWRPLPTSLSPSCRFRFRILSRSKRSNLPLGTSPRPGVRLPTELPRLKRVRLVAEGVGITLAGPSERSRLGESTGNSEVSVIAGLDSAPEHSEKGSSSTRLWGVVNAGFRNCGAENLLGI